MNGDVRVFDRFARVYDLLMPSASRSKLLAGLGQAERDVHRIVDVAGGTGRGVTAVDAPTSLVVDAAPGMLRQARDSNLTAVLGDAAGLPLCGESVDAVLIVDALHHVGDRDGVVREATRILRPGGVLVVADFDPTTLRGRVVETSERAFGFDSEFEPPEALTRRMERAGLDPVVAERGFGYVVAGVA